MFHPLSRSVRMVGMHPEVRVGDPDGLALQVGSGPDQIIIGLISTAL